LELPTIKFEGVKTGFRQSKDGYVLSLAIHPEDVPAELISDFVGARYMIVMVRLDENEQPMNRDNEYPGDAAVKLSGMLCREPMFWQWLTEKEMLFEESEAACTEFLYSYLGIESRKELKTNVEARELFNQLRKTFELWRKKHE